MYRLELMKELSLDWFGYLNSDFIDLNCKHLKSSIDKPANKDQTQLLPFEALRHAEIINKFLTMCKLFQVSELKKKVEARFQITH